MKQTHFTHVIAAGVLAAMTSFATAQTANTLNTFDSDAEDWLVDFTNGTVNATGPTFNGSGGIEFEVTGDGAEFAGLADGFNNGGAFPGDGGGVTDLFGLDGLEYDMSITTDGTPGTASVDFYVKGNGQGFLFLSQGAQNVPTDGTPQTVFAPFSGLAVPDLNGYIATLPQYGFQVSPPNGETWTITVTEVRSVGAGATERFLGEFNDAGLNSGLDGVRINFRENAIVNGFLADPGSTGVGFTHVPAAGVDGAIQFVLEENSPSGDGGPGIHFVEPVSGSTEFRSRPLDLSNYTTMDIVVSADSSDSTTVFMQAYAQTTSGFNFQTFGSVNLPDDGSFATYTFDMTALTDLDVVERFGVEFGEPAVGQTATIQVDTVRVYNTPASVMDWALYR